jgi:NTP pyrophosphatase (non-canonical NTP hydrolase)/nucleoside 2-deoxyribosyltransferase
METAMKVTATVSGSFRKHFDAIVEKVEELRSSGIEVRSPTSLLRVNGGTDQFVLLEGDLGSPSEIERRHLAAVSNSAFLYVVNPGGYIGASTAMEIGYAYALGVPVFALAEPSDDVFASLLRVAPSVGVVLDALALQDEANAVPRHASLGDLQQYVAAATRARGFEGETLPEVMVLFIEEMGELARAIRRETGLSERIQNLTKKLSIGDELADCLFYVLHLSNLSAIDLDAAFGRKELVDASSEWTRQSTVELNR